MISAPCSIVISRSLPPQSVPDLALQLVKEHGGLQAVREAKETHAGDKRGVVKWATKAIEEIEAHSAVRGGRK